MARRNIIAACVLIAFSAAYGLLTARLPERGLPNTPGPAFLPWIITAGLTVLAVALLVQGLRGTGPVGKQPASIATRGWIALAAFVVYLALLGQLGFLLASIPFFAALSMLYGQRNRTVVALTAIVVPTALFAIFRYGFQMLLPRGLWW